MRGDHGAAAAVAADVLGNSSSLDLDADMPALEEPRVHNCSFSFCKIFMQVQTFTSQFHITILFCVLK